MPNAKSERETTEKKRENRENRGILIYSRSRRESIRKLFARARDMCECARSFFFKLFSFFYKVVYIYIYAHALCRRGGAFAHVVFVADLQPARACLVSFYIGIFLFPRCRDTVFAIYMWQPQCGAVLNRATAKF